MILGATKKAPYTAGWRRPFRKVWDIWPVRGGFQWH
jgi:hypothetical protein